MEHKSQHSIPRSYLEAWTDSSSPSEQAPYVWVFSKDGSSIRRKAPKNLFASSDTYTIVSPDGSRNLMIEHGLATIESNFVDVRRRKLEKNLDLDPDEKFWLCLFVAAMHCRTNANLDHIRQSHSHILKHMENLQRGIDEATPERREEIIRALTPRLPPSDEGEKGMTIGSMRKIVATPHTLLFSLVLLEAPILYKMGMALFKAPDGLSLITSDTPIVWVDPTARERPPGARFFGIGSAGVEITMPVSPTLAVFFAQQEQVTGYHDCPSRLVEEINRRTRVHCNQEFIANSSAYTDAMVQLM